MSSTRTRAPAAPATLILTPLQSPVNPKTTTYLSRGAVCVRSGHSLAPPRRCPPVRGPAGVCRQDGSAAATARLSALTFDEARLRGRLYSSEPAVAGV